MKIECFALMVVVAWQSAGAATCQVDFDHFVSPLDNDLANSFSQFAIHQLPDQGVSGGAAVGPQAEITVYGFATFNQTGLRNMAGDFCEVSALFRLASSPFRPASEAGFNLYFIPSTETPPSHLPPIWARMHGPALPLTAPSGYAVGTVPSSNWFRLTFQVMNEGTSDRFGLTAIVQDYGPTGLSPVGPPLSESWEVTDPALARASVIYPGFYAESVRFGMTTVDNFSFTGVAVPRLSLSVIPTISGMAIRWPACATNFVLEAVSNLSPLTTWEPVTNEAVLVNSLYSVVIPFDQPSHFFRLRLR